MDGIADDQIGGGDIGGAVDFDAVVDVAVGGVVVNVVRAVGIDRARVDRQVRGAVGGDAAVVAVGRRRSPRPGGKRGQRRGANQDERCGGGEADPAPLDVDGALLGNRPAFPGVGIPSRPVEPVAVAV